MFDYLASPPRPLHLAVAQPTTDKFRLRVTVDGVLHVLEGATIDIEGWDFVRTYPEGSEASGLLAVYGRPYVASQPASAHAPGDAAERPE